MKFTIARSRFLDGLKAVQNIVVNRGTLLVLQNVRLEANGSELTMTTTDLDISIQCKVECEVLEPGVTTLPVKLLLNSVLKAAEGNVEMEVDKAENATLVAGFAKFKLVGLSEKEFPRLPQDEEAYTYEMACPALKEMMRKTSYAASQDDTRRTLKGVLMSFKDQKLTMVATDGRRLALVESEMEFPKDAERDLILPLKTVLEVQRALGTDGTVKMKVQKSQISFQIDQVMIYSKLIDDTYPNYIQVIPREAKEQVLVDRQLLLDAIERASVMTINEAHSVKLIFESNRLTVTSTANEIGSASDEVPIKYVGERIEIIFNPDYILEPLRAIDEDQVKIEINNGYNPAVIKCDIPFLYVLMPLRLN